MDKLVFELDLNQVNVVLAGLSKLPLEQAVDTFLYVRTKAEEQLAAAQQPTEAPAE